MTKRINIAGRDIGDGFPPYVIAEMSANHNGGDLNAALRNYRGGQASRCRRHKDSNLPP